MRNVARRRCAFRRGGRYSR